MGGKRSEAPDYRGAAEEQAAADFRNLQWQTRANRPDIYTPWGAQTWQINPETGYGVSRITLSPDQQAAFDAQMDIQRQRSEIARGMLGGAAEDIQTPEGFWDNLTERQGAPEMTDPGMFQDYSVPTSYYDPSMLPDGGQAPTVGQNMLNSPTEARFSGLPSLETEYDPQFADAAYSRAMSLLGPQQGRATRDFDQQLINRGLTPGSSLYNEQMGLLRDQQGEDRNRVAWDAVNQGAAEQQRAFQRALGARGQMAGEQQFGFNYGMARDQLGLAQDAQRFGQEMNRGSFLEGQRAQRGQEQMFQTDQDFRRAQMLNNLRQQQFTEDMARYAQGLQGAQFNNQLRNAEIQEQLQREGWNLNKINAFMQGQQVQMPQMPGFMGAGYVGGPNYLGAAQSQGQWDMANNPWGPIGQIAGGLLGGGFGTAMGNRIFGMPG